MTAVPTNDPGSHNDVPVKKSWSLPSLPWLVVGGIAVGAVLVLLLQWAMQMLLIGGLVLAVGAGGTTFTLRRLRRCPDVRTTLPSAGSTKNLTEDLAVARFRAAEAEVMAAKQRLRG